MNCKKIQELILTDYLDGQLGQTGQDEMNKHLGRCKACREFEVKARQSALEPFSAIKEAQPPAYLWNRIKTSVELQERRSFFEPVFEGIHRIFSLPKPIFVLSSAVTIVLISLVLTSSPQFFGNLGNRNLAKAYLEEQIDFLASSNGQPSSNDSVNLDTNVEEYFL